MNENEQKLDELLKSFVQTDEQKAREKLGRAQREAFIKRFPIERISTLSPEEYGIGHGDRENFCWWIERGTAKFSYYFPGSSKSYGMFYDKKTNKYRYFSTAQKYQQAHPEASDAEILTKTILQPVQAFLQSKGAKADETAAAFSGFGGSYLLKLLILYYPDEYVHINSVKWLDQIIVAFGLKTSDSFIEKNQIVRAFYDEKRKLTAHDINNQDFVSIVVDLLGLKGSTWKGETGDGESVRPHFWKISHGSLNTGLSIEDREDTEKRKVVTMHRETAGIGTSPILQGDNFAYALRKGDFAYLCYAGEVRRLVQITDDECVKGNLVDGFVERSYRVIAEAKQIGKYAGTAYKKVWTPNQNSTFARIPTEEYAEFDKNILEPYFGMTVEKLQEKSSESPVARRYWWLMSDPSLWNMAEMPIGDEEYYTVFNENGNKRKEYSAFIGCREGDLLVGYVGKQDRHVCAILECARSLRANKLYFRKVADIPNPVKRDEIISYKKLGEMTPMKSPQGSIFGITKEQFDDICALILKKNPGFEIGDADTFDGYEMDDDGGLEVCESYNKEKFLDEVFMSSQQYEELVGLLRRKKNIILRGAPGVGKTFAARRLAYSLIGSKDKTRTGFVQFHQSYSYENFIRGYKPTANSGFELRDGVFLEFCKRAEEHPDNEYFFIIDEINRGNLSKIFGELLVLIEGDKRGQYDYAVKLAYGDGVHDERFRVPSNLYLIGLMNTADRSLAMIDYALRRRFAFFTVEPALDNPKFRKSLTPELDRLVSAVEILNKTIEDDPSLGKGFKIGHSYFCGDVGSAQEILDYEIAPTLEEYWFEDPAKAQKEIENLRKAIHA